MKKNTMETLVRYLNGETVDNLDEIKAELEAELAKNAEKARVNRDMYATAHDVVMEHLPVAPARLTVAALWELVKDEMPEDMSKSKMQYGLRELWSAEVQKFENPKSANEYARKA
jgi:hypothetical protein